MTFFYSASFFTRAYKTKDDYMIKKGEKLHESEAHLHLSFESFKFLKGCGHFEVWDISSRQKTFFFYKLQIMIPFYFKSVKWIFRSQTREVKL